jgi:type II secretion system protein G
VNLRINKGFSLIELLIVVAIIAILAGIAVPNFLLAQVRSKVSRVQNDLRTLATALESYHVDNQGYPMWQIDGTAINPTSWRLLPLTTPIAYMTTVPPKDPFRDKDMPLMYDTYDYVDAESFAKAGDPEPSFRTRGADWRLCSPGPDCINTYGGPSYMNPLDNPGYDYDPTNGTISKGDICRVGSKSRYPGSHLYPDKVE